MIPFDDIGLEDVSRYSTCQACRKKSDAAKRAGDGTIFCGTHFDEYLSTLFPKSPYFGRKLTPAGFAAELRATRYAACWIDPKE